MRVKSLHRCLSCVVFGLNQVKLLAEIYTRVLLLDKSYLLKICLNLLYLCRCKWTSPLQDLPYFGPTPSLCNRRYRGDCLVSEGFPNILATYLIFRAIEITFLMSPKLATLRRNKLLLFQLFLKLLSRVILILATLNVRKEFLFFILI